MREYMSKIYADMRYYLSLDLVDCLIAYRQLKGSREILLQIPLLYSQMMQNCSLYLKKSCQHFDCRFLCH